MSDEKPNPVINADTRAFWEHCANHRLTLQRCAGCGHVRWPAAHLCPECHSGGADLIDASGRGTVYSYVVYRTAYHPGFVNDLPYVVALIDLEEGPRFLSNIIGCRPEAVRCGMPVEVVWEDMPGGYSLPKFRPRA